MIPHAPPLARRSLFALLLTLTACTGGGNGANPGGPGGVNPPSGQGESATLPGLVRAVAGDGTVRLDWRAAETGVELALFQGATRATVYDGSPVDAPLAGTSTVRTGFPNGTPVFFGIASRLQGETAWRPAGRVLELLPAPPIYVDAASTSAQPDGTTPGSAFPRIFLGVLTAFSNGGGNVWVRGGTYTESFLPIGPFVHVSGGFDADFSLQTRDPEVIETLVRVDASGIGFSIQAAGDGAILDGLVVDGSAGGVVGIDLVDSDAALRDVRVEGFSDRGIRLRNQQLECFDIFLVDCQVLGNGADGLSIIGPFDVFLQGSTFAGNVQEGVELDDLVALAGTTATLDVEECTFRANGTEGLDADLAAPLFPGFQSGSFRVSFRGCLFEENGADGLLVDEDYELAAGWTASIEVLGSRARANGGAGFHVDADGTDSILLHRVLASANRGDGISITSETTEGFAWIAASICEANLGAGVRASIGQKSVAVSHSILAGNVLGGVIDAGGRSSIVNSVAYLQALGASGAEAVALARIDDEKTPAFVRAPRAFTVATLLTGSTLGVSDPGLVAPGDTVELSDDDAARLVKSASSSNVELTEAPTALTLPTPLALWPPAASEVASSYRLVPGSSLTGQALSAPGDPALDPGPFGPSASSSSPPGTFSPSDPP
ncbi:MAG TPA: right-handed parallel beta-helix repeat-containing protein, partial [Planctomycetes bacterium]|nr:right-handed parallel beta-helix repeat-containing protein [Planctomycetota bacterium]